MIAALAFAALGIGWPELDREGPGPQLWQAYRVGARPALLIRTQLELSRHLPPIPRVRQPLVTQWSRSLPLRGAVLGPNDTPIAGAQIELEGASIATFSDHRGEFGFPAVPSGPPAPILIVTAKGIRLSVRAEPSRGETLIVRVPLPES